MLAVVSRSHRGAPIVLLLALLGTASVGNARAQADAAVAARVNGVAIDETRLERALDAYLRQNALGAAHERNPGLYPQLKRQVLDVLIGRELLWQDALARGVVASDAEIEETLLQLQRRFDSESAFTDKLREGGFDRQSYAEEIRRRLSVHKLVNDHLSKSIQITPDEVSAFYRDNIEQYQRPMEVHARHILVKLDRDASEEQQRTAFERAEALRRQLADGADFAALARAHSEGPSASRGGDLGYFGAGRMVPSFESAAFALAPGEVSGPVRTRFGYHLIKVEDRRGGEPVALEDVEDGIRQRLYGLAQQRAAASRARELREAAEIELLVDLEAATARP